MHHPTRPPARRARPWGPLLVATLASLLVALGTAPASATPPPAGGVLAWGPQPFGAVAAGLDSHVRAVSAGGFANLALTDAGTVLAWGGTAYGILDVPSNATGVTAVAAGGQHALALRGDGGVIAWGSNSHGQTSVPAGLSARAVAASSYFSLAARIDGTVVGWGDNRSGEATPPAGLTGVVAVAVGGFHSVALKSDGTVVAWGNNLNNQTQVPAGLTGVVAISAAYNYSLALKDDGTVVSWGRPGGGADVPAGLDDVVAISAGYYHALALKADGSVVGWGYDDQARISGPSALTGGAIAISAGGNDSLVVVTEPAGFTADAPPATATVGTPYSYTFTATGTPAATFSVTAGSLPAGLALDGTTGVLSGTPTTAGTATFTVTASNGVGAPAVGESHTVTVAPQAPGTPASVVVTPGTSQLAVSWAAPAGGPVVRYVVTTSPGGATCTTTGLSCLLGVEAGRAYSVTVTAEGPGDVRIASSAVLSGVVPAPATQSAPPADAPQTLTTPEGAMTTAVAGEEVTLVATGYLPGSTVSFVVYSTPVALGTAVADGSGTARLTVALPASLEAGNHSVVAYGASTDGSTRATRMDFTVAAATPPPGSTSVTGPASVGGLAFTGSAPVLPIALAGITLVTFGAGLVVLTRRRRTA